MGGTLLTINVNLFVPLNKRSAKELPMEWSTGAQGSHYWLSINTLGLLSGLLTVNDPNREQTFQIEIVFYYFFFNDITVKSEAKVKTLCLLLF